MYKYFLVEDDELARACVKKIIDWEEEGFEFGGEAEDGAEALEKITAYNSDIIFTDIKMPIMGGLELIEHLREKYGDTKTIILLTGYDEFSYAKFGMKHGVMNYLLKPIEVGELKECLAAFKEKAKTSAINCISIAEKMCALCSEGDYVSLQNEVDDFFEQMEANDYLVHQILDSCEFVLESIRLYYARIAGHTLEKADGAGVVMPKMITQITEAKECFQQNILGVIGYKDEKNVSEIKKIKKYIEGHYNEKISLSSVAKEFYMSPNYFSSLFKERTGENYSDYLAMVRIRHAKEMLENTTRDMETISDAVGYSNAKYFSNVFYKVTGMRPFEYRKRYREGKKNG